MSDAPAQNHWAGESERRSTSNLQAQRQDADVEDPTSNTEDAHMADAEHSEPTNGTEQGNRTNGNQLPAGSNGEDPMTNGAHVASAERPHENGDEHHSPMADDVSETTSQQTAHRMTTRARANVPSTPSPPGSPSGNENAIHPHFLFPTDSLPDRDLGLPANEAEEIRMLLMAYVQKQEEVARVTTDLHHGLLQADRMRQDVFSWSKAEAHVGEMSDGEDWYDVDEWGLDQELVKGREEEDDDTAVAGKKSTRQRRKPDKEDR